MSLFHDFGVAVLVVSFCCFCSCFFVFVVIWVSSCLLFFCCFSLLSLLCFCVVLCVAYVLDE